MPRFNQQMHFRPNSRPYKMSTLEFTPDQRPIIYKKGSQFQSETHDHQNRPYRHPPRPVTPSIPNIIQDKTSRPGDRESRLGSQPSPKDRERDVSTDYSRSGSTSLPPASPPSSMASGFRFAASEAAPSLSWEMVRQPASTEGSLMYSDMGNW